MQKLIRDILPSRFRHRTVHLHRSNYSSNSKMQRTMTVYLVSKISFCYVEISENDF
jgi:hypothetical protein